MLLDLGVSGALGLRDVFILSLHPVEPLEGEKVDYDGGGLDEENGLVGESDGLGPQEGAGGEDAGETCSRTHVSDGAAGVSFEESEDGSFAEALGDAGEDAGEDREVEVELVLLAALGSLYASDGYGNEGAKGEDGDDAHPHRVLHVHAERAIDETRHGSEQNHEEQEEAHEAVLVELVSQVGGCGLNQGVAIIVENSDHEEGDEELPPVVLYDLVQCGLVKLFQHLL
mmetsp:Transcript_8244/g.13805  ORF Transcript_8244/g.13805 Transcript_8244/m.13805 type:complete len:228 (-) Transcript_8244:6-689(-)